MKNRLLLLAALLRIPLPRRFGIPVRRRWKSGDGHFRVISLQNGQWKISVPLFPITPEEDGRAVKVRSQADLRLLHEHGLTRSFAQRRDAVKALSLALTPKE